MIRLKLPPDYAWNKLLILYKSSHCLEPTERSDPKAGVLEGIVELLQPFWYRLEQRDGQLELSLTAPDASTGSPSKKPGKKDYEAARAWAVRRFWLDLDMEAMREALEVNFLGYSLAGRFWPLVSPAYTSYWASLLRIYCGRGFDLKLRQSLGSRVSFAGKEYPLLPTPQQMMEVSSLELRALGLSSWSSQKLPHITGQFVQDESLQPCHLPGEPAEALHLIHKRFALGFTSAAWVLMRGVIHPDVALEGGHIKRALAEGLGLGQAPKTREYHELMRVHAPYRSFASYYLHLSQMALWRKHWGIEREQ